MPTSRSTSRWIASAVFFLPRYRLADRSRRTELFADNYNLFAEILKLMELGHLTLCLLERGRRDEGLSTGLALHLAGQP